MSLSSSPVSLSPPSSTPASARDEIVGRAAPRRAAATISRTDGAERDDRGVGRALLFLGAIEFVEFDDRRRPGAQVSAMLRADAEQFTDEDDGQRLGKVVDEIELTRVRASSSSVALDDGGDALAQVLDAWRGVNALPTRPRSRVVAPGARWKADGWFRSDRSQPAVDPAAASRVRRVRAREESPFRSVSNAARSTRRRSA